MKLKMGLGAKKLRSDKIFF